MWIDAISTKRVVLAVVSAVHTAVSLLMELDILFEWLLTLGGLRQDIIAARLLERGAIRYNTTFLRHSLL